MFRLEAVLPPKAVVAPAAIRPAATREDLADLQEAGMPGQESSAYYSRIKPNLLL